ncbi:DNA-3-methyladenine glycosylase [Cohnella kolymensis]|uniref:DNA-3-methyladenine glycosylase II n=1 Tax=Cohnella kolymensis TaxID=1590652 RepID=A0ABR5A0F1_9BACL|nr:DNA-3-methyladenine glycosylase [Cohnella kolymensis]KIL34133.1 DNA-3-methyladenine glycosylase [Cohnella kolymensis]
MYVDIKIPLPLEFDYAINMGYLSRSPNEVMFHIDDGKIFRRIPIGHGNPLVEVSRDNPGFLNVRLLENAEPLLKEEREAVIRYVREWFDLDTDLTPFYELAGSDPVLQKVVPALYGLRNIGIDDLFEAVCWGILGQQINLAFAYTLKRRFVESFGHSMDHNGVRYWTFPSPDVIASLSTADLTALQITGKKSEYLIGVAGLISEGKLSKRSLLDTADCKEAEKQLVSIRGIGPWTANYVLMRCLRFPSAFPIDDVGLHNAIKAVLGLEQKPSVQLIRQLSASWTNWEAYATFYLWRYLY